MHKRRERREDILSGMITSEIDCNWFFALYCAYFITKNIPLWLWTQVDFSLLHLRTAINLAGWDNDLITVRKWSQVILGHHTVLKNFKRSKPDINASTQAIHYHAAEFNVLCICYPFSSFLFVPFKVALLPFFWGGYGQLSHLIPTQ